MSYMEKDMRSDPTISVLPAKQQLANGGSN
jgi:hypothetical protein